MFLEIFYSSECIHVCPSPHLITVGKSSEVYNHIKLKAPAILNRPITANDVDNQLMSRNSPLASANKAGKISFSSLNLDKTGYKVYLLYKSLQS